MKKILLIVSLSLFAAFSFAQKKAVKEAKSAVSETAKARELIKPALTDAETSDDPETWKVAGDIEYKAFEKEYELEITKEMTGKAGNENVMYTGLYNMVDLYKKADELGQLPDPKGKIKNKVRKDIAKNFKVAYPFYINGGIYYNDLAQKASEQGDAAGSKANLIKASDFFLTYWDIPSMDVFEGEQIVEQDSIFQTIKYYAVISAFQSEDHERTVSALKKIIESPYVQTSSHKESDSYELLCSEYERVNDSVNYIKALELGAAKFPKNQYFTTNLINVYIKAGDADLAMDYLDQAVKNDPSTSCELLGLKASLLSSDKKYSEAEKLYLDVLALDSNCEKALDGLGVLYVLQAQDSKEKVSRTTNREELSKIDKETIAFYEKSIPHLEKYVKLLEARGAEQYDLNRPLNNLENVYYNLVLLNVDKNAELDAIEKKLGK